MKPGNNRCSWLKMILETEITNLFHLKILQIQIFLKNSRHTNYKNWHMTECWRIRGLSLIVLIMMWLDKYMYVLQDFLPPHSTFIHSILPDWRRRWSSSYSLRLEEQVPPELELHWEQLLPNHPRAVRMVITARAALRLRPSKVSSCISRPKFKISL